MTRAAELVAPAALAGELGAPGLVVLDATVELRRGAGAGDAPYAPVAGREGFEAARLPGARLADLVGALADPAAPHPFGWPSPERVGEALAALGIGAGSRVVAYAQGSPMWATRLWFLLRAHGFDAVRVLDGGLPAWRTAGYPIESGAVDDVEPVASPGRFLPRLRPELLASRADVEAIVAGGDARACLVNALRPEVFRGEDGGTYGRPGRIPGSRSLPYATVLDADGRFRPDPELRELLGAAGLLDPATPVVGYCGGGISATLDLFALARAGREDARLYDGSLAEWAGDPALPLEVG